MTYLFAFFISSRVFFSDSLPPLHSFKEEEIDTVIASYKNQTIDVKLKTGINYTYHKDDWSREDDGKLPGKLNVATALITRTYTKVQSPPSFPGGDDAWKKYIQEICSRNKKLIRKEGPAVIFVQFTVDNNGEISNIRVASSNPPPGLAALAQKAIEDSPAWLPGSENGRKVVCFKIQKIEFNH